MTPSHPFRLEFAPDVVQHLVSIDRKYHRLIRITLNEQLLFSPLEQTRNRKPLDPPAPFSATWDLRFGPNNRFRVFYEVNEIENTVWILGIGIKDGNRLLIGGEEFTP